MSRPLRIAVASGKGGTGKTTLATNLAVLLAETGARVAFLDCDVEEPNGHIFLAPTLATQTAVTLPVPVVDPARCTLCGACGDACRFSAILALPTQVLTFPSLCHGCGGCALACPADAIQETPRAIGVVETGVAGRLAFLQGRLDVGEALSPPVIRAVLAAAPVAHLLVIDAPPGTACPVVAAVKGADLVLLVAEPTPFGLSDLRLAVATVRELGLPCAVVINRAGSGEDELRAYCAAECLPVPLAIPDDRRIAEAYSRGELAIAALPPLRQAFQSLIDQLPALAAAPRPRPAVRPALPLAPREAAPPLPPRRAGDLRELVVLSGKGGTGKTSVAASFFALAERAAVADCDVDAPDLHLVLDPRVLERGPFAGGRKASIDTECCSDCGLCAEHCRFDAIERVGTNGRAAYRVDPLACEGCGVCVDCCPVGAATLLESAGGEWFISATRHGPLAHARLGIAQENSGKLVSLVRRQGAQVALAGRRELLISDGSPGIGCPVIASIAGARLALIVTEPTLSGLHDLRRVAELCRQSGVAAAICINKADLNLDVCAQIEAEAAGRGIPVLGRIRYDAAVTAAQVKRLSVVECGDGPAACDIRALWERVKQASA
jgi:MinD superfamily P-loop ATPase